MRNYDDKFVEEIMKERMVLKQQLAEKEKEIEDCNDEWTKICDGKLETINRLIEEKHELKQSQTQTAIAELNNILDTFAFFVNEEKESIVSPDGNGNLSLLEYIENRIDALKGETDGSTN